MPITKGAHKAHRSSLKKRVYNVRRARAMHEGVKAFRTLVADGKTKEAEALLPTLYKVIDKAAKCGVIKENTAARKKSRLVSTIAKAK